MKIELNDFIPRHTFDCGQCFRWNQESDGSYMGVAGGRAVKISSDGANIELSGCSEEDYADFWDKYLDVRRDYGKIKKAVSVNDTMRRAVEYGGGIRILRQEFFETLISFIISQRSSIPKIRSCVEKLCTLYGKEISFGGKTLHAFPSAETLARLSEEDFRAIGVGYRAPYILSAAQKVAGGEISGSELENCETGKARELLLKLYGVGDKVCDCVLLFSLGKYDLFPSDVWIKRVMAEQFSANDAKHTGEETFGAYSGFAQQYLFYWRKYAESRKI